MPDRRLRLLGDFRPHFGDPPLHYDRRPVGVFIFARSSFGESNRVYEAHGVVLYILVVTKHIDQVLQPCLGVVGRAI